MKYEVVIGLEVHAELNSQTKIFCSCKNEYGASANTLTCPVCLGLPGALPVLNNRTVELAVMTGLILGSKINNKVVFERRNYFHPSLAKSYQLTQCHSPICIGGGIRLDSGKKIKINRIHLEEDSAKMISGTDGHSYLDFNRSGVPLVEIVTEPMLSNTDEVVEFVMKLRDALVFAGISDCRMQEGGLRFDVNMSVRPEGTRDLGTRVELKNLSSFKTIAKALDYETRRQIRELELGGEVRRETRVWNDILNRTYGLRDKEYSKDYRFFPDPNLKTLVITDEDIETIKSTMPTPKQTRIEKYEELGLSESAINVLTSEKYISDYFDSVFALTNNAIETANWIISDILHITKDNHGLGISHIVSEENLAFIIKQVLSEKISRNIAKVLLNEVASTGKLASTLVKEMGLQGVVEDADIVDIINSEIAVNPNIIDEYCCSPEDITNYMLGKIMYATNGKAMPDRAKELVVKILNK